jgi:hypothetical protein
VFSLPPSLLRSASRGERGAASVEHAGLALLIALLVLGAVAALASEPGADGGRELGSTLARKLRCAARLPAPCWRDPLTDAYGRPLAGLVRALVPRPAARIGPSGAPVLPVDFRYCRRESCAAPGDAESLTASNRRVTAFTSVDDRRRSTGSVEVTYWLYRPGLGWETVERTATGAETAVAAKTPLLETDHPRLVPLETLPGRNHYEFPASEEPPWRWEVESVYPGWRGA